MDYPSALTWRPPLPTLFVTFLRLWTDDPMVIYRLFCGTAIGGLVVAMYLQLGDMKTRGELYRTCQGCGGPFWSPGGKQKFCDSLCGDAFRQRRFYRHPKR